MDGKLIVNELRGIISKCRDNGHSQIPLENLEVYIGSVEKYATECYDYQRLKHESELEMFRSVISSGANAVKAAMIINGGGAVALLTFASRIKDSTIKLDFDSLSVSLFFFCVGVFFAALGSGCTYFTQRAYRYKKKRKLAVGLNIAAAFLVVLSYFIFFTAVFFAAESMGMNLLGVISSIGVHKA